MESKKNILISILIIVVIAIVDFFTKLFFNDKNFVVIKNVLEIKNANNYGLIYGIFSNSILLTIIVPLIILILFTWLLFFKKIKNGIMISGSLVMAGIIGNVISRIYYGYVVDWIYIPFVQPVFPNFNIADASSFIGVLIMIYFILKEK